MTGNILKHAAPGPCSLQVAREGETVEVLATNTVPEQPAHALPGGHGLTELKEMLGALGGVLEAGPAVPGSSTWVAQVRLPLGGGDG